MSLRSFLRSYVFLRFIRAVIVIFVVVTITFFLVRLIPGNPVDLYIVSLETTYSIPYEQAKALASTIFNINLNQPLYVQYFHFMYNVLRGNLGRSMFLNGQPVTSVIAQFLPWTVFTVGTGLLISFVLGILIGMSTAYKRGGMLDSAFIIISSVLNAVPNFIVAILIILVLGDYLGVVPFSMLRGGYSSDVIPGWNLPFIVSVINHSIFPIVTYVLTTIGGWVLLMRNSTVSALGEDYVMVARARGLQDRKIATKYVGRNAILPLFTSLTIAIAFIFSGSTLVESTFVYPGIGLRLLQAVNQRDYPVMEGIFLVITIAVVLANYIADVLYSVLDPRIRVR